jgi:hypothetical protein
MDRNISLTLEEQQWDLILQLLTQLDTDDADALALELRRQLVEDENLYDYLLAPQDPPEPEPVQAIPSYRLYRIADPRWWDKTKRRIDTDLPKFKARRD